MSVPRVHQVKRNPFAVVPYFGVHMARCYWWITYDHNTAWNTRRFTTCDRRDRKTIAIASTWNTVVIIFKHAGHALQQLNTRWIVFVGYILAQYPEQFLWVCVPGRKIFCIVQAFFDLFTHHFDRVGYVFVRYLHFHSGKLAKTPGSCLVRLKNRFPGKKKRPRPLLYHNNKYII